MAYGKADQGRIGKVRFCMDAQSKRASGETDFAASAFHLPKKRKLKY